MPMPSFVLSLLGRIVRCDVDVEHVSSGIRFLASIRRLILLPRRHSPTRTCLRRTLPGDLTFLVWPKELRTPGSRADTRIPRRASPQAATCRSHRRAR